MEVLKSPISSLHLPSTHRETLNLLKSPLPSQSPNLPSFKPNPKPFFLSSSKPLSPLSLSPSPPPPPPQTHHRPATGYAATLIVFSTRGQTLTIASIARDVDRLAASIAAFIADYSMADEERAEAVRAAVESGGFDRRLLALARMVVSRGAEEVAEILEEFGRIRREMDSAVVVVVVSEKKMGMERLATVAREVQRTCGAAQVKMKYLFRRRA